MTLELSPLRARSDGTPIIYGVLGMQFHLETPEPAHAEGYELACEAVREWIGEQLRWTHTSTFGEPEPYQSDDLSYVPNHARSAHPREFPGGQELGNAITSWMEGDFTMICHGAEEDWQASPYSFRYHARVPDHGQPFKGYAMLRVTVPATESLTVFQARAVQLASALPVRWGAAGLMMSGWEIDNYQETHDAMYAVARRYPGFDPGFYASENPKQGRYASQMALWHNSLRTVNWLTFLGPAMLARIPRDQNPATREHARVQVAQLGQLLLLQAGKSPEPGDVNRLDYPAAYVEADQLVRSIRARGGTHFLAPWTKHETELWLNRFERGVSSPGSP